MAELSQLKKSKELAETAYEGYKQGIMTQLSVPAIGDIVDSEKPIGKAIAKIKIEQRLLTGASKEPAAIRVELKGPIVRNDGVISTRKVSFTKTYLWK